MTDGVMRSAADEGENWELSARAVRLARTGSAEQPFALIPEVDTTSVHADGAPDSILITASAAVLLLLDLAEQLNFSVRPPAAEDDPSTQAEAQRHIALIQQIRAYRIAFMSLSVDEDELFRRIFGDTVLLPQERSAPLIPRQCSAPVPGPDETGPSR